MVQLCRWLLITIGVRSDNGSHEWLPVVYCHEGKEIMEEMNHGYFEEALSNFTKDFAYGGAIRHLVDHGYTVDRIIKEFDYPISRESIEKIVNQYLAQKK